MNPDQHDDVCDCDACLEELGMTRDEYERRMAENREAVRRLFFRKPCDPQL